MGIVAGGAGPYDGWMDTSPPLRVDAALRAARVRIDADDARLLVAHALERTPSWLYAHDDAVLTAAEAARVEALVERRAAGEPVAYLTGRRGFWDLDLAVGPATLIPRADTECLVEATLACVAPGLPLRVADLGTGSGAIALAIAGSRPAARVVATDASATALGVALANARRLGIANVSFVRGDWLRPLRAGAFDVIASNPPYIAAGDPHLAQGDLRFEPAMALASGADGLDAIRTIVAAAPACLVDGGWLLLEHGHDQGKAVRTLLAAAGFVDIATRRDLGGRDRVTLGCRGAGR